MRIADIAKAMQGKGYRPNEDPRDIAGAVGQMAAIEPTVVRTERGVYRIKPGLTAKKPPATTTNPQPIVDEPTGKEALSKDALLVTVELLEMHNRALHDAHIALLRGMTHAQ